MHSKILFISIIFLLSASLAGYLYIDTAPVAEKTEVADIQSNSNLSANDRLVASPFSATDSESNSTRLNSLENEISLIKQQLQEIQLVMQGLSSAADEAKSGNLAAAESPQASDNNRPASLLGRHLYSYENLIKGGIEPGFAEDLARRKNAVELKRLELQDRATRGGYLNTQRYYDELDNINRQDINLRDELGDALYDEYLYNSKQNNRVRIASVMLGSAAEQAGIKNGDIVLSYDNKKIFNWRELKAATTEGNLGEYVFISVYRNGEIFSFSVPRGPLGTQLGATRLMP